MALNNLGLGFVFTARDLASGTITRVGGAFGALDRNALRAQASYQRNFAVLGAGLGIMATGAATLAGAFALAEQASAFEQNIARVGGIAQASAEDVERLRREAIRAGTFSGFNPNEAADALGALASQGFNASQSMELMDQTLAFAAGGMVTAEQAAMSLAAATHVFGLNMEESQLAADQMLRITNSTALAAGDMELAIGTVARGATQTGQGIEEMLPAMGLLKNRGLDVSVAAQSVSSALTFMSSRAGAIRQTLGVELTETLADGTQAFRPFMDIAIEAGEALQDRFANPAERTAIATELFSRFGVGAVTGTFQALQQGVRDAEGTLYQGRAAIEFLRREMENAAGAAEEFRNRLLDTYAGQKQLLGAAWDTLGIVIGEAFAGGLRPFIEGTLELVQTLVGFVEGIPAPIRNAFATMVIAAGAIMAGLGTVIALGAAIAIIAPFIKAIAIAVGSLLLAMAPFILAAAAVVALGVAFNALVHSSDALEARLERIYDIGYLLFHGLVQLFTEGELSGGIAEAFMRPENEGLLTFLVDVYAIGFRVVQFFRGIGVGFMAVLETMGPSIDALLTSFSQLGEALGVIGAEGRDAVAGMPSEGFMAEGAKIGAVLAGALEDIVHGITSMSEFLIGAIDGWREFYSGVAPGVDNLGDSVEFLMEQFRDLGRDMGWVADQGESSEITIRDVGEAVGTVLAGAVDFLVFLLDGLIYVLGGIVFLFRLFGLTMNALPRVVVFVGEVISAVFHQIYDDFMALIDGMIIGLASLARRIPAGLRPAGMNELIGAGREASGRQRARDRGASQRRNAVRTSFANIMPAEEEARGNTRQAARADARNEAALAAVRQVMDRQARERQQPIQVDVNIDGERAGRAVVRGNNRDNRGSFADAPAED